MDAHPRRRSRRVVAAALAAALLLIQAAVVGTGPPVSAAVPTGFVERIAFSGLVNPTALEFAPDGRVFVAEKRGTVQMFDSLADTTPTQVADLRTEVYNFWDRGLLGLAVHPTFPTPSDLYVLYTFDGPVGGLAPRWGTAGVDSDPCPTPPGATDDGCVVSGKLAKLTLNGTTTTKQDLIHDWCQQYPSHSVGDVMFGRDGALYVSGGDGASFNWVDYGQDGNPVNPCGDPPGGAPGTALTAPTAEGGALRSQDLRTSGDPTGLDGTVIRVDPKTGDALPDNPGAASADANTRRIVAHGFRNPFRMTQRPGTDEVWVGDVGWSTWEEVNRIAAPTAGVLNYGWPCYEGDGRQGGYDAANLKICEDLYAQTTADTKPYYPYRHGQALNTNDNCNTTRGSSIAGLSFSFYGLGPYPAEYDGALFFADYSRNCVWVMTKGTDGLPDKAKAKPFVSTAASPVELEVSPAGELYYADFNGGTIRRVVYQGTGPVTCAAGEYRAEYFANTTLTAPAASTLCETAPLSHAWGSGGPPGVGVDNFSSRWTGTFDFPAGGTYTFTAVTDDGMRVWVDDVLLIDQWRAQGATTYTASRHLATGAHRVRVEYFEQTGQAVARLSWAADAAANAPPQAQIASPAAGTTWQVGDVIAFSGSATDAEDGVLPAGRLRWQTVLQHCPADCHDHPMGTLEGVASGSVTGPDHEYPARLALVLTATDSRGATDTETLVLDPLTAAVTVASQPAGLQLTIGQRTASAPVTTTLIRGGRTGISAPSPQTLNGVSYAFQGWSDGGTQTHDITASAPSQTYTATYAPVPAAACPVGQYRAEYFANRTLSGTPVRTACEAAPLNHRWGSGGPSGVGSNNFSARWTGTFDFPAGTRTFNAAHDDGMRVWVDNVAVIDQWAGARTSSTGTAPLAAGTHQVKVEYWEKTGTATAVMNWQ